MEKWIVFGLAVLFVSSPEAMRLDSCLAQASNGELSGKPRRGVVVLHGGQVFSGQITRAGDLYHVVFPNGEIRLRASQVAFHCDSIEEAYQRRRETIRLGHAESHIEMARWCQRNGLLDEAARELADAAATDPNNPWIPYMERSLRPVVHPVESPGAAADSRKDSGPTSTDLDRMVREMSPQSVAAFTSSVQPVLLNTCATGGCHGPSGESRFRLMRGREGRPPTRRVTQRNLHATLEWINREQPEASPLLTEAIRAHGTSDNPVFTEKDAAKYRQMVQWVYGMAQTSPSGVAGPKTVDPRGLAEARAMTAGAVEPSPHRVDRTAGSFEAPAGGGVDSTPFDRPATPNGAMHGATRSPVKRGAEVDSFVPADPFDPEVFNRRYHPER